MSRVRKESSISKELEAIRKATENICKITEAVPSKIHSLVVNRLLGLLDRQTQNFEQLVQLSGAKEEALQKVLKERLKHSLELDRYDTEELTFPPCDMSDEQTIACGDWLYSFMEQVEQNVMDALKEVFEEQPKLLEGISHEQPK